MRIKKMRKSFSYCLTTDYLKGELFSSLIKRKKVRKTDLARIILRVKKKEVNKRFMLVA